MTDSYFLETPGKWKSELKDKKNDQTKYFLVPFFILQNQTVNVTLFDRAMSLHVNEQLNITLDTEGVKLMCKKRTKTDGIKYVLTNTT